MPIFKYEDLLMREITIREFAEIVTDNGKTFDIVSDIGSLDEYGMLLNIPNVSISFDKDYSELIFKFGTGEMVYSVEDCIGKVSANRNNDMLHIAFNFFMPDITLREHVKECTNHGKKYKNKKT